MTKNSQRRRSPKHGMKKARRTPAQMHSETRGASQRREPHKGRVRGDLPKKSSPHNSRDLSVEIPAEFTETKKQFPALSKGKESGGEVAQRPHVDLPERAGQEENRPHNSAAASQKRHNRRATARPTERNRQIVTRLDRQERRRRKGQESPLPVYYPSLRELSARRGRHPLIEPWKVLLWADRYERDLLACQSKVDWERLRLAGDHDDVVGAFARVPEDQRPLGFTQIIPLILDTVRSRGFPKRSRKAQIYFLADSLGGLGEVTPRRSRDICDRERRNPKPRNSVTRCEFYIECTCGYRGPALNNACPKCKTPIPITPLDKQIRELRRFLNADIGDLWKAVRRWRRDSKPTGSGNVSRE